MFYVFNSQDICRYVTEDERDAERQAWFYDGYYTEDPSIGFNSWVDDDNPHRIEDAYINEQEKDW